MDWLRVYLLLGLIVHKAVWEMLKRRGPSSRPSKAIPLKIWLVKAVKVSILGAILVQTVAPEVFPLAGDPTNLRILGFTLYTIGLATALAGRIQLGDNWLDIEVADVKREQETVSEGIYQYVRHPIYTGDVLLLVGLELALNSWLVVLVALITPLILRQAIREEQMLKRTLKGYEGYCRQTWRFIPFVA
jgi:protein-S-isoprenylcysteine O-methyltransferase Ste14